LVEKLGRCGGTDGYDGFDDEDSEHPHWQVLYPTAVMPFIDELDPDHTKKEVRCWYDGLPTDETHSEAEQDTKQPVRAKGTVAELSW